jgi:hypothetical protein
VTRSGIAIALLSATLVVTNLWWAYKVLDAGVSNAYLAVSYEDNKQALAQVIALVPILANGNASREEIIAVAQGAASDPDSFEKEGFVWVGRIGLRFGPNGELQEISRSWSPP